MRRVYLLSALFLLVVTCASAQECFDYASLYDYESSYIDFPVSGGRHIAVDGDRGCIALSDSLIQILDLTQPDNVVLGGTYDAGAGIGVLKMSRGLAYIGTADHRLLTLDLAEAAAPLLEAELYFDSTIRDLDVSNSYIAILLENSVVFYNSALDVVHSVSGLPDDPGDMVEIKITDDFCAFTTESCTFEWLECGGNVNCSYELSLIDMNSSAPFSVISTIPVEASNLLEGPEATNGRLLLENSWKRYSCINEFDSHISYYGNLCEVDVSNLNAPNIVDSYSVDYSDGVARSDNGDLYSVGLDRLRIYEAQSEYMLLNQVRFLYDYKRVDLDYDNGNIYAMCYDNFESRLYILSVADLSRFPQTDHIDQILPASKGAIEETAIVHTLYSGFSLGHDVVLYESTKNVSALYQVDETGLFHDLNRRLYYIDPITGNDSLLVYTRELNVSDPRPARIMDWRTGVLLYKSAEPVGWTDAEKIDLVGTRLIYTDMDSTYVIDLSDPTTPTQVWSMSPSLGLKGKNFVVHDGYLYHVDWDNKMSEVWQIDQSGALVFIGPIFDLSFFPPALLKIVHDDLCLISMSGGTTWLFDISDPSTPSLMGQSSLPFSANMISVGDYAYTFGLYSSDCLDGAGSAINVYDMRATLSPILVQTVFHDEYLESLQYVGGHIVTCSFCAGSLTSYMLNCPTSISNELSNWVAILQDDGTVAVSWRYTSASPLRLKAIDGGGERIVPFTTSDGFSYQALDPFAVTSKSDHEIVYVLERQQDGFWLELARETLQLPQAAFTLAQPVPNPFNPATQLSYTLDQAGPVTMVIYDVAGRRVRELVNEPQAVGSYVVEWNGRDDGGRFSPAGVYFVRLQACDRVQTRKLALIK